MCNTYTQDTGYIELPTPTLHHENQNMLRKDPNGTIYVYKLFGEVELPEKYLEIIDVLQTATEKDKFILELASDGGYIDGYVALAHALLNTKAKTTAVIHRAYSSAALLALTCDNMEINLFSSMMIHPIHVDDKNTKEVSTNRKVFNNAYYTHLTKKVYGTFFTEEEIASLDTKGVWLYSEDIIKRMETWIPIRKRKGD